MNKKKKYVLGLVDNKYHMTGHEGVQQESALQEDRHEAARKDSAQQVVCLQEAARQEASR